MNIPREEADFVNSLMNSGDGGWSGGGPASYGNDWPEVRERVLERDNHSCQDCDCSSELHVHHIEPLTGFESSDEANELDNLVTLCQTCHLDRHS